MQITDIKEYLRRQKEAQAVDGMSIWDFANELGIHRAAAKRFVTKEVEAGRLKPNGIRPFKGVDGRTFYHPVYVLVPHEAED